MRALPLEALWAAAPYSADKANIWYVGAAGSNEQAPRFDATRIGELTQMIDEHNTAWRQWFALGRGLAAPGALTVEWLRRYPAGH
jgi:LPS sulfotransferase NodH